MKLITIFAALSLLFTSSSNQRIMLHQKQENLVNGKVIVQHSDIYYEYDQGKMIIHFQHPEEMFIIMNNKGELKIYNPAKNEVFLQNNMAYSTDLMMLYFFIAGKTYDMGLQEMGFFLNNTKFEDGLMVSEFYPSNEGIIGKIILAHENDKPIYAGYYDSDLEMIRKIYYYDYATYDNLLLPLKSVEYDYLPSGDSIITRKTFSDIKIGKKAKSTHFDFKVPDDAKSVSEDAIDLN